MNLVLLHPDDYCASRTVRLDGRRLQHVLAVHRAAPGDRLTVGLENGRIGTGTILALDSRRLEMAIALDREPPSALPLRLVLALPRPKMLKRVLQSAVSMGVKQLHLINSYRVEKSFWGSPLLTPEGLREPVVLGLEQARDTILPDIRLHKLFKPFVEDQLPALVSGSTPLVAHPGSPEPLPGAEAAPVTLAIGPEGGFIPYEIELLRHCGFRPVSFGPRILRVETAVPALLSRFMKIGDDHGL
jgi:RsmE family RNA methyltransferase